MTRRKKEDDTEDKAVAEGIEALPQKKTAPPRPGLGARRDGDKDNPINPKTGEYIQETSSEE